MSDPFIGEIRMFAGNFAPRGWAFCDGQLLAIGSNDALFSLLGTIYGGDGRTTFGLPDMRGRIPIHAGSGPGLASRRLGVKSGVEKVTVTTNQLPSHTHDLKATSVSGTGQNPIASVAAETGTLAIYSSAYAAGSTNDAFAATAVSNVGGSGSHTNLMPALCVHFIIALFGIYPSRQ